MRDIHVHATPCTMWFPHDYTSRRLAAWDPGVRGLPSRVSLVWRRGCGVSFVDVDTNATSRVGALDVDYDDVSLHKIICQPSGD